MQTVVTAPFRFGRFELDPAARQLRAEGNSVALGGRALDLLIALVERRDRLVTKDELFELAWPGLVVEEGNLHVQISALRKTLGANAISTIPGRGYRFALELSPSTDSFHETRAVRHNLPMQLTSFVGHDDDLNAYAEILEQTRLLTLTGIGGCGKTRLAIKLAERVVDSFADGVCYADLAPLFDAERLPLTIATVLGVAIESNLSVVDALCGHLAGRDLLLVLDNCEHLTAACAALLPRLLAAAPSLRLLVTSREGLGIPGERIAAVRSLTFPPPDSKVDCETLEACEAVRLFVDRVRLWVPEFSLSAETANAVAEISRRLDGIPLAIELAAARMKVLSIEEIRDRLHDRFRLLVGGGRAAVARHQTLMAVVQWSYEHLTADEQRLLNRLAVFVGDWTLRAAAFVAGDGSNEYGVLNMLSRLAELSLITCRRVDGAATRYAMLETVRQYALERLNESGEGDTAQNRHLEYYLALSEEAERQLHGAGQSEWLAQFELERENFLAAHARCDVAEGGAEAGMRLAFNLMRYFKHRGLMPVALRICEKAIARPGAQKDGMVRGRALWAAGMLSYFMGRYDAAADYMAESLAIARAAGDESRMASAEHMLGAAELARGNKTLALSHVEGALNISRVIGDKYQLASALNSLAELHRAEGLLHVARPLYEEALNLERQLGDRIRASNELGNLAKTLIGLGLGGQSMDPLSDGLAFADKAGLKRICIAHLDCVAGLATYFGEPALALRLFGAIERHADEMGIRREPADELFIAPLIATAREKLGLECSARCEADGRVLSYGEAVNEARTWLESRTLKSQ
jgi:non-specific serine/threonine protein kinase